MAMMREMTAAMTDSGSSRRQVLGASAVGLTAAALGAGGGYAAGRANAAAAPARDRADTTGLNGAATEPFYGAHQAGVETPPQAHGQFIALNLKAGMDKTKAVRMLRLLTDDAAAMTQGAAPLADVEGELNQRPARLTVTFGFGRKFVELAGPAPDWLKPLPKYSIDQFEAPRTAGDFLLQICSDDPATVAHASRMLLKDARAFMDFAWARNSFRRAYGSDPQGTTIRNPFGQVDGTANPGPGSEDFNRLVWGSTTGATPQVFGPRGEPPTDLADHYPDWLRGGTTLVLRDIKMTMDTWDQTDRPAREFAVGRKLDTGAPTTGESEFDLPDFEAKNPIGLSVISPASHMARSRNNDSPEEQIFRRVYSYQEAPDAQAMANGGAGPTGLMFASYQANIDRQFKPIQDRLAQMDLLNEWTVPIGSTVWAIPPGVQEGEYIGQTLFG